ncbi:hypothetical protein Tco_1145989 [Tanacetum coccineum]
MMKMVPYEAFACLCGAGDVGLRESYKHETCGKLYYACPRSKPRENTFGCKKFLWKEERVRLLVGSAGASTTPIYSPGSSSTPIYSPGSSTPPRYSPGASTPPSYSLGTSRNTECSNCKHLLDKITVLEATVDMYMHPEQHTVNSAALFHEVYNNMGKLDLEYRGSILSKDLTYSMLHEMVMQKFNLEANAEINFSFKLSSFDFAVDITDDAEVRGSPYEAFEMLPYYCYNLEQKNEGTVTRIKTDDKGVFEMLFIAIGASNLSLKNKKRKGLFWKICKAYTREDYATSMNILQIVQPDAYEKLCRAGPQRWSRAHCPLVRYNYMAPNSVESVNACSMIYRKEPELKLAETYRAMVQEWYYKCRQLAGIIVANMTYEITDWAANKVAKKG